MSQLAFFPWIQLRSELSVGDYQFLPFARGARPGPDQGVIDAVLEPYKGPSGHPISDAVILTVNGRGLTEDMPEDLHQDLFALGEIVAIAGLAKRRFFGHVGYTNRDHYRLVIQGFKDSGGGALVTNRRRDGSWNSYITEEVYQVLCPWHVLPTEVVLEVPFLKALLGAMNTQEWPRIYQAMITYNEANTDRREMPPAAEVVLCYAAIEQLLDAAGQPASVLAARFAEMFAPYRRCPKKEWKLESSEAGITKRLHSAPNLAYGWVEDLAITRGSVAHGHDMEAYPSIWSIHEHLLLASFAIPRLLKCVLAKLDLYQLSQDDVDEVNAFEFLLNERHLEKRDPHEPASALWSKLISRQLIHRLAEEAADQVFPDEASD